MAQTSLGSRSEENENESPMACLFYLANTLRSFVEYGAQVSALFSYEAAPALGVDEGRNGSHVMAVDVGG